MGLVARGLPSFGNVLLCRNRQGCWVEIVMACCMGFCLKAFLANVIKSQSVPQFVNRSRDRFIEVLKRVLYAAIAVERLFLMLTWNGCNICRLTIGVGNACLTLISAQYCYSSAIIILVRSFIHLVLCFPYPGQYLTRLALGQPYATALGMPERRNSHSRVAFRERSGLGGQR